MGTIDTLIRRAAVLLAGGLLFAFPLAGAPGRDVPADTLKRMEPVRLFAAGALKTNLLFDLLGGPNLGVTVPMGESFTLTADVAWADWQLSNLYALKTFQGGASVRYWFDPLRWKSMTGWSAGLYVLYSSGYDVQLQDGYQGDEFFSAGLVGAYGMPLSRRLNLEFSLYAGYFFTPELRHYHRPQDGHLIWIETRRRVRRIMPIRAQVNLVWLFNKR